MNRAAQRRAASVGRRAGLGGRPCRCGGAAATGREDHRRTGLSCTSPPRQRLRRDAAASLRDDADRRTLPPQPVHCHDVVTAPHYPAQLLLGAQSLCTDETHSQDQCVVRPPARRGTEHVYGTTTALADAHGLDTLDTSDALSQGGPDAPWCAVTSVTGSQPRVRAGLVVVAGEGVTAQGSHGHALGWSGSWSCRGRVRVGGWLRADPCGGWLSRSVPYPQSGPPAPAPVLRHSPTTASPPLFRG